MVPVLAHGFRAAEPSSTGARAGRIASHHGADGPVGWPVARMSHWSEESWWNTQIDSAIADPDPANVNARITLLHRELALAMRRVIGADAGPSYHAWAVWASLKAGRIIRREEAGWAARAAPTTMARASAAILAGNVSVIDDVGRHSARFVCAFGRAPARTSAELEKVLEPLSAEPSSRGGQSLLREAYRHYLMAATEQDAHRRDQAMLLANLCTVLHEHFRLQPIFESSIPWPLRRAITRYGLGFRLGAERLSAGHDIVAPAGSSTYPATLTSIRLPGLQMFLDQWDRNPDTPVGSGARDWRRISDRMNYIVDLFRSRHHDPNVHRAPYDLGEQRRILAFSPT